MSKWQIYPFFSTAKLFFPIFPCSVEIRNHSSISTSNSDNCSPICSVVGSRKSSRASRRASSACRGAGGPDILLEESFPVQYTVAILGASGVGKSSLTSQFLSSDHMNTYDSVGKQVFYIYCITYFNVKHVTSLTQKWSEHEWGNFVHSKACWFVVASWEIGFFFFGNKWNEWSRHFDISRKLSQKECKI